MNLVDFKELMYYNFSKEFVGREVNLMTKKIRAITISSVILIIICACCALTVVNGKSIDAVESANMEANTSDSITVKWKKVKNAEGYRIYLKNNDTDEYKLFREIEGEDTLFYEFDELGGGTVYNIEVTAFKHFNKKVYESEKAQSLTIYTLPDKPKQTAASPKEGILSVKWEEVKNALGYELEYAKDNAFKDKSTENMEDGKKTSFKLEKLTPKDVYYTHLRAYIEIDGNKVYGEWSDVCETKIKEKFVMGADIDPKKPIVALSFDDGPGYPYDGKASTTSQILDVLEEYGARATFFMCGSRVDNSNVDCLKREIELGCELGNHTFDHKHYGKKVTKSDISKCSEWIKEKSGKAPTIYRCPGGMITPVMKEQCKKEGMPIAYWSVDTEDWKSKDPDKIYDIVNKQVYDGAIILMHDIYPTTVEAVKKIVPKLIEDGYQIVGVSEMLAAKNGEMPTPGEQYVDYKTINNNT